tara:strand:- start:326 stop:1039 length:714 start_codon:yes stop_codon:yes gene_type:complete
MSDLKVDGITAATSNTAVTIKGLGTGKVVLGDGELIWPDSDGSANQYIKTDGSKNLAFATLPAVGAWILIQSQVASSSASLTFTSGINSTYSTYALVLSNILPATDAVDAMIRVSTNTGSSYANSGYLSFIDKSNSSAASSDGDNGVTSGLGIAADIDNGAFGGLTSVIYISNPSSGVAYTYLASSGSIFQSAGTHVAAADGHAVWKTVTAVDALQLILSSGAIASGRATLYGISHT